MARSTLRLTDLTGQVFGRLTVVSYAGSDSKRNRTWLCRCACGTEKVIRGSSLTKGSTKSCLCLHRENSSARMKRQCTRHGMRHTPEYEIWKSMVRRGTGRSDRELYFDRGIRVCERWRDFANFYADMGPRPSTKHSLDREDNDGNYEPGNCRWADSAVQGRNKRTNKLLTYNGETLCATEWAERLGVKPQLLLDRIRLGWSDERILTTPAHTTA